MNFLLVLLVILNIDPVRADAPDLAYSREWLRLMHYQPHGNGFKSELDGKGFYFAPDGRTNPRAEIEASLEAFKQDLKVSRLKLHPQCAFPERFRFLMEHTRADIKPVDCPVFKEFLSGFHGAKATTLVFSSAYPNNPASMFGHSFLKIESDRKNELLDSGINYAAFTPPDANIFAFMYLGVFGGYQGTWSRDPYFKKVNDYINAESRDLWEYQLTLNQQETLRLLAHIWELEVNSHFDYFFFDENCSYQILRAIEAIKPDWNLSEHRIYVIPGETIKRVSDVPGAVREVRFRPSLYHQLEMQFAHLSDEERKTYRDYMNGKTVAPERMSVRVMDTLLTGILHRKARKKRKWSAEDQARENQVLELRSKNPTSPMRIEPPAHLLTSRPDWGHDPYSAHFSGGWLERDEIGATSLFRLKLKSAYHDLLAPDHGFTPFSEIEFPWVEFHADKKGARLQELGLISSTSLFPLTHFDQRPSWRLRWAAETERGRECQNCLLPGFEAAYGLALGDHAYRLYAFALGKAEVHSQLQHGYRLRPGLELGWIWKPKEKYKMRLVGRRFWNSIANELRWEHSTPISRNQELRQTSYIHHDDHFGRPAWLEFRLEWISYFR